MFTSHGHQIKGTTAEEMPTGHRVARCGGPGLCGNCSVEAAQAQRDLDTRPETRTDPSNPTVQARLFVMTHRNSHVSEARDLCEIGDIYVVSFAYILGGWKAMLSTKFRDDRYYEVTHNGVNGQTYLDDYEKVQNVCFEADHPVHQV